MEADGEIKKLDKKIKHSDPKEEADILANPDDYLSEDQTNHLFGLDGVKDVKSSESTVDSIKQGEVATLYHGSNKSFDSIRSSKSQAGTGIFLTDSEESAKNYGEKVYEVKVKPEKIAYDDDFTTASNELISELEAKQDELEAQYENDEISFSDYTDADKRIRSEIADIEDGTIADGNEAVFKRQKENGFDVLVGELQSGEKGLEVLILNDKAIQGT